MRYGQAIHQHEVWCALLPRRRSLVLARSPNPHLTPARTDFDKADDLDGFEDLNEEDQARVTKAFDEGQGEPFSPITSVRRASAGADLRANQLRTRIFPIVRGSPRRVMPRRRRRRT